MLPALAVFTASGLILWRLPGVYMDAVDPDYLVLNILHPDAPPVFDWALPGTLFLGRYLVIGQIYHGALPVYAGLPVYATLGTRLFGIRMTELWFGLLVLAAAFAMMRARGVRPIIAAPVLLALAADPDFVFAWRTQFYITLLPCALLMLSAAIGARARGRLAAVLSGAACGAACYGYFIYAFLAPAAFGVAWRRQRRPLLWLAGFALGVAPYVWGLWLLMGATGGPDALPGVLRDQARGLGVAASPLGAAGRLDFAWALLRGLLIGIPPARTMFEMPVEALTGPLKLVLLGAAPLLAAIRGPGLAALWVLGFVALVCAFGDRLGPHHAIMLLPLLYAGLAEAFEWRARTRSRVHPATRAAAITFATLALIAGNAVDQARVFAALGRTGGVGLASDALTRFAADEAADPSPRRVFLPDWGVLLSLEMLADGALDAIGGGDGGWVHATLCEARDAEAVFVARPGGDPFARIAAWTEAGPLPPPAVRRYAQRDGTLVLAVARWDFHVRDDACLAPAPAAR